MVLIGIFHYVEDSNSGRTPGLLKSLDVPGSNICGEGGMHYALRALLAARAPWSSLESSTAWTIPIRVEPSGL